MENKTPKKIWSNDPQIWFLPIFPGILLANKCRILMLFSSSEEWIFVEAHTQYFQSMDPEKNMQIMLDYYINSPE